MEYCSFAKSIFLSDKQEIESDKITFVKIDKITSRQQYSSFILKELNNYIDTDFVLIVQHDGFIINPSSWNDDFLKIPWPLNLPVKISPKDARGKRFQGARPFD